MKIRFKPPINGITATVGSMFSPHGNTRGAPVDFDEEGNTLFKEDVIAKIMDDLQNRKNERTVLEAQWTLNANFLIGNQYCDINPYRGDIEQILPEKDYLERETFNQIAPLIETRIANLKKIKYLMTVKPATNEMDDYHKAEVSTEVLRHIQKNSDFERKKNTLIWWNELCGNCFILSWWDKNKGDMIAKATEIKQNADGTISKFEEAYSEGDIDYGLITPYEIYPESIFKQGVEAQRSIILEQVKSVEEVYDMYDIKVEGKEVETFELTPLGNGGGFDGERTVTTVGHRSMPNACKVVTYFEKPSKHRPNGLMAIIINEDELVYYGDLPYDRIPIVQCICREVPGQFFGKSAIEDLIPRQRALNGCINRIHEYIKRISLGGYFAEEGSVDIDEFEENGLEPGGITEYRNGTHPPTPKPQGILPGEVMQERYNLKADMEYAAGVSQLMVNGATPSGITSGAAISNLMEIDNTRLSLTGDMIRNAVRDLAVLWLQIYKKYATTRRIANFTGRNNLGGVVVWSGSDIKSYDIEYETENELLYSEDMQKQKFMECYNMGFFTDANGRIPERVKIRALEASRIGSYSDIMNINLLQVQAAQRENVFFENGSIPELSEFDDHEIHIEEHMRYILQMDFKLLKMKKPKYAEAIEEHIRQHKKAAEEEKMKEAGQMIPPGMQM